MVFTSQEPEGMTQWEDYRAWIKDIKGLYDDEATRQIKQCTMWEYTVRLALKRSV